jgi:hypothetical protein
MEAMKKVEFLSPHPFQPSRREKEEKESITAISCTLRPSLSTLITRTKRAG